MNESETRSSVVDSSERISSLGCISVATHLAGNETT